MALRISRRRLMARGIGGAAGLLVLPSAHSAFAYAANERLNLGVVGMAGYGAYHGFGQLIHTYGNVAYAVSCDVDLRKVRKVYDIWEQRAKEWPASAKEEERAAAKAYYGPLAEKKPPLYADFRRMLDEARDRIDAVVVATPDHTHSVIAAAALRAGKPVLAEKPLSISAHEARALQKLAAENPRLPTQMNNGGTASPGFRRGVEIIREGVIGSVREVHMFFSRGGRNFKQPPQGVEEVPKELDWNLWLAQVAWREYNAAWINRIGWRGTSIGELGNFGPHTANMAFMSLDVGALWKGGGGKPIRVTAECAEANQLSYPTWEHIRWEIPARGDLPPVTFTWHHGPPPNCAPGSQKLITELLRDHGATEQQVKAVLAVGCLIIGGQGVLLTNSHNTDVTLLPQKKYEAVEQRSPKTLPKAPGQYKEWIEAIRGGPAPMSNFAYAAPYAEFLCVGSIATRFPGETIEFDPATGHITNHPKAAAFLSYEYRKGWTI